MDHLLHRGRIFQNIFLFFLFITIFFKFIYLSIFFFIFIIYLFINYFLLCKNIIYIPFVAVSCISICQYVIAEVEGNNVLGRFWSDGLSRKCTGTKKQHIIHMVKRVIILYVVFHIWKLTSTCSHLDLIEFRMPCDFAIMWPVLTILDQLIIKQTLSHQVRLNLLVEKAYWYTCLK